MPRRPVSTAGTGAVVFALLVLATVAAFAWSQRLKRDPLLLDRVSLRPVPAPRAKAPPARAFTPNGDCRYDLVRIRFRVTRSDRATVQVVERGGRRVATLARDVFLKRYRFHTFYWSGRELDAGLARPGPYRLRVVLLGQDRTLVPGEYIRLHDVPPAEPAPDCEGTDAAGRAGNRR